MQTVGMTFVLECCITCLTLNLSSAKAMAKSHSKIQKNLANNYFQDFLLDVNELNLEVMNVIVKGTATGCLAFSRSDQGPVCNA